MDLKEKEKLKKEADELLKKNGFNKVGGKKNYQKCQNRLKAELYLKSIGKQIKSKSNAHNKQQRINRKSNL